MPLSQYYGCHSTRGTRAKYATEKWGKKCSTRQSFIFPKWHSFKIGTLVGPTVEDFNSLWFWLETIKLKYQFWKKSLRKNETLAGWTLSQHICLHFWAWLLLYSAITLKSEDKYVVKLFNPPEFLFSQVTFFQNWYFSSKLTIFSFFIYCIFGRILVLRYKNQLMSCQCFTKAWIWNQTKLNK